MCGRVREISGLAQRERRGDRTCLKENEAGPSVSGGPFVRGKRAAPVVREKRAGPFVREKREEKGAAAVR